MFDMQSDPNGKSDFKRLTLRDLAEMVGKAKPLERDPNGVAPNTPGAKLDAGKPPVFRGLLDYFPRACKAVADVSAFGASKYTWKGWESVPEGESRYSDALVRHILDRGIEGPFTKDSKLLHRAHAAWNALAVLELELRRLEGTDTCLPLLPR